MPVLSVIFGQFVFRTIRPVALSRQVPNKADDLSRISHGKIEKAVTSWHKCFCEKNFRQRSGSAFS
jgi:hypothetical protein